MKKMMRRVMTVLLAAALTAGLSLTAFAAGESETAAGSFNFTKAYQSTDGETFPSETLEFEVTADSANPDSSKLITVGTNNKFEVTGMTNDVPVNYPSFSKVGVYRYTIKEKEGSSQGVTYDTKTEIKVAILVAYNKDHTGLTVEAGVEKAEPDAEKVDTITNIYELGGGNEDDDDPAGASLSVSKTVEGNLADQEKYFTMKVTLTAEKTVNSDIAISGGSDSGNPTSVAKGWTGAKEVSINLKNGDTIKFDKIPVGVTYAVEEDAKHIAAGTTPTTEELNGEEGYIVSYTDETGTVAKGAKPLAAVKNTKETEIHTGISLDSLPYIMILAAAVFGAIVIFRRRVED